MSHVKPIVMKFMIYSIIILFVLLFYGFSFGSLLLLAAIMATVTYVFGDLLILPLKGNLIATVVDGGVVLLGVLFWIAPSFGLEFSIFAGAIFVAVMIAACEWFFHIYVIGRSWREGRESNYQ